MASNNNKQCFDDCCHWADCTISAITIPLLQNKAEAHLLLQDDPHCTAAVF